MSAANKTNSGNRTAAFNHRNYIKRRQEYLFLFVSIFSYFLSSFSFSSRWFYTGISKQGPVVKIYDSGRNDYPEIDRLAHSFNPTGLLIWKTQKGPLPSFWGFLWPLGWSPSFTLQAIPVYWGQAGKDLPDVFCLLLKRHYMNKRGEFQGLWKND